MTVRDLIETNLVLNFLALADSCQTTTNQSAHFAVQIMPRIEEILRKEVKNKKLLELVDKL